MIFLLVLFVWLEYNCSFIHHWSLSIEVAQFVYQERISKLKHEKQQFLKTEEVEKEENTKIDGW